LNNVDKKVELLNRLRQAYDNKVSERDEGEIAVWKVAERSRFLSEFNGGTGRLLEIGCGTGRDSLFFKENGFSVTSTDLSPGNVALCQSKGLDARVMSFFDLEFPTAHFDAVFALNCLLHVPRENLVEVLHGISHILRPGGLFYMGVYGGEDREGEFDYDRYEPRRFFSYYSDERIIEAVSEVFELIYFRHVEVGIDGHFQSMILKAGGGTLSHHSRSSGI